MSALDCINSSKGVCELLRENGYRGRAVYMVTLICEPKSKYFANINVLFSAVTENICEEGGPRKSRAGGILFPNEN